MSSFNPTTGIGHFRITEKIRLSDFLKTLSPGVLGIEPTAERISDWFYWGCLYLDGKRQKEDVLAKPGQTLRLHTRPKRYVVPPDGLRHRVIFQDEDLLVLDKPAGLPVHPTLDNQIENAKHLLEVELGLPLWTTHRLDIATQGLLIFAKNPRAQTQINKAFLHGRVDKIYHAEARRALSVGHHVFYLNPQTRVPREFSFEEREGWWRCEMEILFVEPVNSVHRHRIRLITGKTHQIRAHFAALGAPLIGDSLYGEGSDREELALQCVSLTLPFRSRVLTFHRPV